MGLMLMLGILFSDEMYRHDWMPLFQEIEFTKEEATCEGVSMIVLENKIKSVEKAHVVPMCSGVPMSPIKKRALNLSGLQPWKSLVTHGERYS